MIRVLFVSAFVLAAPLPATLVPACPSLVRLLAAARDLQKPENRRFFELSEPAQVRQWRPKRRITKPIPGLYESIPLEDVVVGDALVGDQRVSSVTDPTKTGMVRRDIFPDEKMMHFETASIPEELSFVDVPGTKPLVPGRGIPTQMYLTLQHMRKNGIPYGGLRKATTGMIDNKRTQIQLAISEPVKAFAKKHPGDPIPASIIEPLLPTTQTYQYIEDVLTQSGHRIKSCRITRMVTTKLKHMISEKVALDPHLQKHGPELEKLGLDHSVPINLRLEFVLEPIPH